MISSVGFTLTLVQPVSLQFIVAEIPSDKVPGVVRPVWSKHFSRDIQIMVETGDI